MALRVVFDNIYFSFNNKIYNQVFGASMGSPFSPILTDITLQDLEKIALNRLDFYSSLYVRYVDDIAMIVPTDKFNVVLDTFNSYHPRLQSFTLESSFNGNLNFLDLTIIKNNGSLIYNWFQKLTSSDRYLHYYSHHFSSQKKGIVVGLIDRAFFLSNPIFHKENFEQIFNILTMNDGE